MYTFCMKKKISNLSPKKNLEKVRKNIDKLDFQILEILSKRRREVLKVIKYKPKSKIIDKKRISEMLKKRISKGKKLKIESFIIERIWLTMINSFIELEKKKYK
jgi:chorismate mutase